MVLRGLVLGFSIVGLLNISVSCTRPPMTHRYIAIR